MRRASRRLYVLRHLRQSDCSDKWLINGYISFVRSVLLYCCPVMCNAPLYLVQKLINIEKRAFKIMNIKSECTLLDNIMNETCLRLFQKTLQNPSHPLRRMFRTRTISHRNSCPLRPPFTRTERFRLSFIKFADRSV